MLRLSSVSTMAPAEGVLRNLLMLRGYGMAAQLIVLAVAVWGVHIELPLQALLTIIAAGALLNGLTWFRLSRPWPVTMPECFLQLLADVALLTWLLYFAGGASNSFVSLYLLPIMIAATALEPWMAWVLTGLSVLAYSVLMQWYVPLVMPPGSAAFGLHVVGMWLNFILSAWLITYFIGRMAQSIRQRDQALARIREQRLRDEQIVALGSLAAGTTHELSTPLATMTVVTGELLHEFGHQPELAASLSLLQQQIAACKAILTRLTRTDAAERAESGGVVSVKPWLADLLDQWRVIRPQVEYSLRWMDDEPVPQLFAGDTLAQALLNLCNNAADAGGDKVEIEVSWSARSIQIDILDRGSGFTDELPIGTAFFTTKRDQGGSGIGLILANASIEQYGGSVSLLARPGGGARVAVNLPCLTVETTK